PLDCRGVDVGRNDGSAFPRHREGARMADALARGRDERGLAFESSGHGSCARNGEFYAQCNKPIGVPPTLAAVAAALQAYAAADPCMNVSTRKANAMRHAASAAGA